MKKYFFKLAIPAVLFCLIFVSCTTEIFDEEEKVEFLLPSWPPDDSRKENYPALSRWLITASSGQSIYEFYLPSGETSCSLSLKKNTPYAIMASPVTFLTDGRETLFFKPAGAIYPYFTYGESNLFSENLKQQLLWEDGFSAHIFFQIIKNKPTSEGNIDFLLRSFNWKKFCSKIRTNLLDSRDGKFYNPWQLSSETIIKKLFEGSFDSGCLDTKYVFSVDLQNLPLTSAADSILLSSFIPENETIHLHNQVSVKKSIAQSFLFENQYSVVVTATSAKNLSVLLLYMPIFIPDI